MSTGSRYAFASGTRLHSLRQSEPRALADLSSSRVLRGAQGVIGFIGFRWFTGFTGVYYLEQVVCRTIVLLIFALWVLGHYSAGSGGAGVV